MIKKSYILGNKYWFLIVALFNWQWSIEILHEPSFFLTQITSTPEGDTLGFISTKSNNSFNFIFNSYNSCIDILYGVLAISSVPGFNSIIKSISLLGGKHGNSYGNTSTHSHTTGRFSNPFSSPFSFRAKISYNWHPFCMLLCSCREEVNLKDTLWFLPTITVLCPKSSIKLNCFILQFSITSCDSNQSIPITMS